MHPAGKKQQAATPVERWQDAADPWTEPRPLLPTWATVARWACLGGWLIGVAAGGQLGIPIGFALLFAAFGTEAYASRGAEKAPYPRVRRPLFALGVGVIGILLVAGLQLGFLPLIVLGIALATAYRLWTTRVARAAAAVA